MRGNSSKSILLSAIAVTSIEGVIDEGDPVAAVWASPESLLHYFLGHYSAMDTRRPGVDAWFGRRSRGVSC